MSNSGRGALTLLCPKFNRPFATGLREGTLHSSRDEGRPVDRRSGLLAPGFSKAARIHRIEPDFIDEPDYYVDVSHSDAYVRRVWGEYFEVVDTVPGMTATHDLAVLRKR